MRDDLKISIIIPTYNEEQYIEECLNSVIKFRGLNNYWHEVLVIDGRSNDTTREIVESISLKYSQLFLIDNEKKIQSAALNIGIKKAKGDYIMRLDAHSRYPKNYLKMLVETASRTNADNVGGIVITEPGGKAYGAHLVQALTTHKFGVGNSGFRTGAKEDRADTVPFGFFKKEIFNKIGLFDERLVRCQDYEFNRRIAKNGGLIWMNPDIQITYYNQSSLWKFLKKQILKEAPYNPYMWYLYPYTFAYRHAITGVFTLGVILGGIMSVIWPIVFWLWAAVLILYFLLAIASSFQQALKYKNNLHIVSLPLSFFLYHFMHGVGIWIGIVKLVTQTSPVQTNRNI